MRCRGRRCGRLLRGPPGGHENGARETRHHFPDSYRDNLRSPGRLDLSSTSYRAVDGDSRRHLISQSPSPGDWGLSLARPLQDVCCGGRYV